MLLATDLDGTFLGGSAAARTRLYRLISGHPGIKLAFVTGRGLESVLPLLADPTIPSPDYVICDVGATVVTGHDQQPLQPLQADIDARWPGEQTVADAFSDISGLDRQEVPQARRCSYFCSSAVVTSELHKRAQALGCDVLYSADRYLDILPTGVNKGSTLRGLIQLLEIDEDDVLVAGDTLNDLAMYEQGFKGVCVGGSEAGLLRQTRRLKRVLHAKRPGAGGILDALSYFGFLGPKALAVGEAAPTEPGRAELVMLYHRLPYEEYESNGEIQRRPPSSPNGIIPTLLSFFGDGRQGSWIAWAVHEGKRETFEAYTEVDADRYPNLIAARVPLPKKDVDTFYKIFSKEAFWPTLHTFWERAVFKESHWQVFLRVNKAFAERAATEAASGATVWIHDYNLWMVPAYLRDLRPDLKIAFFHHTYFPSADVFNVLPWRRQIIGSLLHCDYVGFHIPRQVENFVDVVRGAAPITILERTQCAPRFMTYGCAVGLDQMTTRMAVGVGGRTLSVGAHPVGVSVERVRDALSKPTVKDLIEELRRQFGERRVVLSVQRLDYTKGTLEELQAFEQLLARHHELHGKVVLAMVCVPSAPEMSVYRQLQQQIQEVVGRINGRFSSFDWTPVRFYFRSLPFDEIVAHYAVADVMWITPLRDGLNLVAKEYVATQGLCNGHGVLVLSEFAGAAAELKGALLTNPHDTQDLYENCYRAICMSQPEAESRLRELFDIVSHYDLRRWGDDFLAAVEEATRKQPHLATEPTVTQTLAEALP